MVLNSLFPVFTLILLGHLLKRFHLTNEVFLRTSDKLVYFIFFPAMLFFKIGGAPSAGAIEFDYCLAAVCALVVVFIVSSLFIFLFSVGDYQAGTFSQSCYRFNTYIGMAIVINAYGEEGVRYFGLLIGIVIPLINVMAVSTLIWFSGKRPSAKQRVGLTLRALVSNPLILGCLAGMLYARFIHRFPVFLDNTLHLVSLVTLPLALLSIGGALTLKNLGQYFRLSLVAAVFKLGLLPVTGYVFLRAFNITGVPFQISMLFFALPASTAIYVLSSQLNSDTELASATIVLSTLLSFFSLSAALTLVSGGAFF